jgi:hypothetical protein
MGWKTLRHPNVLPLLGVTMTETQFVMVSEWMVRGDINQFVKTNINADRLGLVCFFSTGFSQSLDVYDYMIIIAQRRCRGVDLYA